MSVSPNKKQSSVQKAKKDKKENAKRKDLLKQIQELRCIIEQCEWSLNTLRFKDVETTIKQYDSKVSQRSSEIPNVPVKLQTDLYKFAGFQCVTFKRNEVVFNLSSVVERQIENTQALQIFIKNGKGSLGKWVMPMSIDMNHMLTTIPIDKLENLNTFIKSCKHSTDCYTARQEQFLSLKEHISTMKYCAVHSDISYMRINLELYSVHDTENDSYIDLVIYLLYNSTEARPYKLKVDTLSKSSLSNETQEKLKACLTEFKILDLETAFDKVLENNSSFVWIREDDSDSPLEMNNSYSSEEENFLKQLLSDRKRSMRITKKKQEIQKKWKERMKRKTLRVISGNNNDDNNDNTDDGDDNDDNDNVHSMTEASANKSLQVSRQEKKKKSTTKSSKQRKNTGKSLLEEKTPVNKSKAKSKLKQTHLNFQTNQSTNNASEETLSKLSNLPKRDKKRKRKLITSTPLHHKHLLLSSHLEIDNITQIGSPKNPSE